MTDDQLIEALRGIDSALLADAIEELKLRNRTEGYADCRLRPLVAHSTPMVGYAVTMQVDSTSPDLEADGSKFAELGAAVVRARKPFVIVVEEVGASPDRGCGMGDMLGTMLSRNGAVGAVCSSGARDLRGLEKLGMWVFARNPVVAHGVYTIKAVGVEVEVAGLRVAPDDLLHGNGDGLLNVPTERPAELLEFVRHVRDKEAERMRLAGPGWTGWPSSEGVARILAGSNGSD